MGNGYGLWIACIATRKGDSGKEDNGIYYPQPIVYGFGVQPDGAQPDGQSTLRLLRNWRATLSCTGCPSGEPCSCGILAAKNIKPGAENFLAKKDGERLPQFRPVLAKHRSRITWEQVTGSMYFTKPKEEEDEKQKPDKGEEEPCRPTTPRKRPRATSRWSSLPRKEAGTPCAPNTGTCPRCKGKGKGGGSFCGLFSPNGCRSCGKKKRRRMAVRDDKKAGKTNQGPM